MPDSRCAGAERAVQPRFSKLNLFNSLCLAGLILATAFWLRSNRPPLDLEPANATIQWVTVDLDALSNTRARLVGAWELQSDDRRVGGISGLSFDRGRLLALTDGGMLIWLDKPGQGGKAMIRPLPAVSGNPRTKIGRDSEALMRSPDGRGWWVAFEQRHQLIRYDMEFTEARERIEVIDPRFRKNRGIEALSSDKGIRWYAERSGVSDAAPLADGRVLLLRRDFGLTGFAAGITGLGGSEITLPVRPLDNVEGLAAESLPGGAIRLWIATDNDFRPWRRTLVMAVDFPADGER
jgi:hypothetical protein